MIRKRTVSLYLNEDLVERAKKKNINISAECEKILNVMLQSGGEFTNEELQYEILKQERESAERILKLKQADEGLALKKVKEIDKSVKEIEPCIEQIRVSRKVAMLYKQLNYEIEIARYNPEVVWKNAEELIAKFKEYDHPIDLEYLKKHCQTIRDARKEFGVGYGG